MADKPRRRVKDEIRQQSRAAYQELIVRAAERVFAKRGFAGARVSDIADEAGVAIGTLYNYFDSKDAIFRALLELRTGLFLAEINRVYGEHKHPLERIAAVVRACMSYLDAHRAAYAVFLELGGIAEASLGRIAGDRVVDQYTQYVSAMERAIRAASRAKLLRADVGSAGSLAAYLTGSINGLARAWILNGAKRSLVDDAEFVVDTFLRGVQR